MHTHDTRGDALRAARAHPPGTAGAAAGVETSASKEGNCPRSRTLANNASAGGGESARASDIGAAPRPAAGNRDGARASSTYQVRVRWRSFALAAAPILHSSRMRCSVVLRNERPPPVTPANDRGCRLRPAATIASHHSQAAGCQSKHGALGSGCRVRIRSTLPRPHVRVALWRTAHPLAGSARGAAAAARRVGAARRRAGRAAAAGNQRVPRRCRRRAPRQRRRPHRGLCQRGHDVPQRRRHAAGDGPAVPVAGSRGGARVGRSRLRGLQRRGRRRASDSRRRERDGGHITEPVQQPQRRGAGPGWRRRACGLRRG
jgi:hypothetical protein